MAYIALGSNKGDRLFYLKEAVKEIKNNSKCKIIKSSSVYETKPFGPVEQGNFLNAVIKIEVNLSITELFSLTKEIEKKIGREKTKKWGPREIDLDLLYFNDEIYSDSKLKIPHKGIAERDFVLVPLTEIAPDYIHPEIMEKNSDICKRNSGQNIIKKLNENIV